jgi:hypothetical protein
MVGDADIHGNPYGVTSDDHHSDHHHDMWWASTVSANGGDAFSFLPVRARGEEIEFNA